VSERIVEGTRQHPLGVRGGGTGCACFVVGRASSLLARGLVPAYASSVTLPQVLIIEGDAGTAHRTVADALKLDGFDVPEASRTEDGLGAFVARCRPVAILLDVDTPGAAHGGAHAWLLDHPEARGIPIIAVWAAAPPPEEERRWDGWLGKPLDPNALRTLLGSVCCRSPTELALGFDKMDVEHGLQFRLADALVRTLIPGADPQHGFAILKDIVEVTRWHFAYEAELMRRHAYPAAQEHEREHVDWLLAVEEIQRGAQRILPLGTGLAVRSSMVEHVRTMDGALARSLPRRAE
jgi:hemerythrin-like metal-binding protein